MQDGPHQLAQPAVGRVLMVTLVPQQVVALGTGVKRQGGEGERVTLGQQPGDVGRGGEQAVGAQQDLDRCLKEGHLGKPAPGSPEGGEDLGHRAVLVTTATHLQVGPGEVVVEGQRLAGQGVVCPHQYHQAVFPLQPTADEIRHLLGDGGDQIQLQLPQARQLALVPQLVIDGSERCLFGQGGADLRQDVLGHVVGRGEAKHPVASGRFERRRRIEPLEGTEVAVQLGRQQLGTRGEQPTLPLAHQQGIAKLAAQLHQLLADGGLAQVQQLGGAAHVTGFQQHLEGRQQVEIGHGDSGETTMP